MKEALGDYMAMVCNVDGLCLTDSSYNNVVKAYSWVKDLALSYVKQYGQRVFNIALNGQKPKFLYTPFQVNDSSCNPKIICNQLLEYVNKHNLSHIIIPRPNNYEVIRNILSELLDDRFIVMTDDPAYMNFVSSEIDDGESYPNLADDYINEPTVNSVCVTGHRPNGLYGYSDFQSWSALQNKIYTCCNQLYTDFNVRKFGNGGAQGVDMAFFFCVEYLKTQHSDVQNIVYRPFSTHGANFRNTGLFNINEYNKMLNQATEVKLPQQSPSLLDKNTITRCLLQRNIDMINEHEYVIGVYKGDENLIKTDTRTPGGTLHALRYAYNTGKKIILINPQTLVAKRFNFI